MVSRRVRTLSPSYATALFCIAAMFVSFYTVHFALPLPEVYQGRWVNCIDFLSKGTLYGGQTQCEQMPVIYIVGLVLSKLGFAGLESMTWVFLYVIHTFLLFMLFKIVNVGRWSDIVVLTVMYSVIVLPVAAPEMVLAAAYMVCGFYVLSEEITPKRALASGFLFALSVATKLTLAAIALGVFLVYFVPLIIKYATVKGRRRVEYTPDNILQLVSFIAPFAAAFALLSIIFPNIWVYTTLSGWYTTQMTHNAIPASSPGSHCFGNDCGSLGGYVEAVFKFVAISPFSDPHSFTVCFVFVVVLAFYTVSRERLAAVYLISMPINFLYFFSWEFKTFDLFNPDVNYYMVPVNVILLATIGIFLRGLKSNQELAAFSVSFVLLAVFAGNPRAFDVGFVHEVGLPRSVNEIEPVRDEVNGVYRLLPSNAKRVLVDGAQYKSLWMKYAPLERSKVDVAQEPFLYDGGYLPGLVHYGVLKGGYYLPRFNETRDRQLNLSYYHDYLLNEKTYPGEAELVSKIRNKSYDMILVSSAGQLTYLVNLLKKYDIDLGKDYCNVMFPEFTVDKGANAGSIVHLKDRGMCIRLRIGMKNYMDKEFESLCRKDSQAATKFFIEIPSWNNMRGFNRNRLPAMTIVKHKCESGADVIGDYIQNKDKVSLRVPAFLGFGALAAWFFYYRPARRKPVRRRVSSSRGSSRT